MTIIGKYKTCIILTVACATATVVVNLVKGDIAGAIIQPTVIGIGTLAVFFGAKNPDLIPKNNLKWEHGKFRLYETDPTAIPEERLKLSAALFSLIFATALLLLRFCY